MSSLAIAAAAVVAILMWIYVAELFFGEGGSHVLMAVYLFKLHSVPADICFAVPNGHDFTLIIPYVAELSTMKSILSSLIHNEQKDFQVFRLFKDLTAISLRPY